MVFTRQVLRAWKTIIDRHFQKSPAARPGEKGCIAHLKFQLRPFIGLKTPIAEYLRHTPGLENLRVYDPRFWTPNAKGALLQAHVRIVAAPVRDKTRGRFQLTLCPENTVRTEYVANKVTQPDRPFHISRLSDAMKDREWLYRFRRRCLRLPPGFRLRCTCGDGTPINEFVSELTAEHWRMLREHGLNDSEYFLIYRDRHWLEIADWPAQRLAATVVQDWAELRPLIPLLESEMLLSRPRYRHRTRSRRRRKAEKTFKPEFAGERAEYAVAGTIRTRCDHGFVINSLADELQRIGFTVRRDQQRDLYTVDDAGQIAILFEAKTDLSTDSLYSGTGQLMLHGAGWGRAPRRVFVMPHEPDTATREKLQEIGIEMLTYRIDGDRVTFRGMAELLSRSIGKPDLN